MSITCKICQKEFLKQITNSHLKLHQITTIEYKNTYGSDSLSSSEYRNEKSKNMSGVNNPNYGNKWSEDQKENLSEKLSGKQAWNKGIPASEKQKNKQSISMIEKYANGYFNTNTGKELDDVTKDKISISVKKYATTHKEELSSRAKLAVTTKKEKGYAFAFFKGKTHNIETLKKISVKSKEAWDYRNKNKYNIYKEKINKYGFELLSETFDDDKIEIKCKTCGGKFERNLAVFYDSKYHNHICKICNPTNIPEMEIRDYLISLNIVFQQNTRNIISPLELDIYIPDLNIAIEYCGLYWHSELNGKDKKYHLNKMKLCNEKGIRLITIFEDEWIFNKEICKNRIKHILGLNTDNIYARKCIIKEINTNDAKIFINNNHLQGYNNAKVKIGLLYNKEIVAVMTFSKKSISKGSKPTINDWELSRFCESIRVIGGASKLLKYFIKTYNPKSIISYADKRWSLGNLYNKIGFVQLTDTPPNYWYIKLQKRIHRFVLRKKKNESKNFTEWEIRQSQGWNRIWDCGNFKYILEF